MTTNPTTPPEPQAGATPDLAAIQARCDAATPGPWSAEAVFDSFETAIVAPDVPDQGSPNVIASALCEEMDMRQAVKDTRFIAHARTDIPALLAALATSRAETEEVELALEVSQEMREELRAQLATLTATLAQREAEVAELRAEVPLISGKIHNEARTCLGKTHRHKSSDGSEWACLPIGQVVTPMESLIADNVRIAAARDTALARVRELEAAMDELKRRLNALETDVYKYQNQCDPEEAIPAYITGEIERISKSASDAAARAAGKGEEGAGV